MGLERSYSRVNFHSELEGGAFNETHPELGAVENIDQSLMVYTITSGYLFFLFKC